MTAALIDKRGREVVKLPWALNTTGLSILMKEWQASPNGFALKDKHKMTQKEWLKLQEIVKRLRQKGFKLKILKLTSGGFDKEVDWDILRKAAKDMGIV